MTESNNEFRVKGVVYDLDGALGNPKLNALEWLKRHEDLGLRSIMDGLKAYERLNNDAEAQRKAGDPNAPGQNDVYMAVMEDIPMLRALKGLVWLVRTNAGERADAGTRYFTLDEANEEIGLADIDWPEADEPDPTVEGVELEPLSSSTTSEQTSTSNSL
jgi:hypothetical protein